MIKMTLEEIRKAENVDCNKRKAEFLEGIKASLLDRVDFCNFNILDIAEDTEYGSLRVSSAFTIDGYTQNRVFYWKYEESLDDFASGVKRQIDYIKRLREEYPKFCKDNDFIQTRRRFSRDLRLTHAGFAKSYNFSVALCDYMELPNTTSCGVGGGDYEIKRTPKRVEEYNNNIDKTIDFMIDCISDLKKMKLETEE